MSLSPGRLVVLWMLCCIFLQRHQVRGRGSSSGSRKTKVTNTKDEMRLLSGDQKCEGRLQVKSHDSWRDVCHSAFTALNGFVTCKDFDCGYPDNKYGLWIRSGEVISWGDTFNCSDQEQHLSDCPVAPLESNEGCRPTFLECTEKPAFPEIKVYSLEGSDGSVDGLVYSGHSYVIMCRSDAPLKVHSFFLRAYMGSGEDHEWSQPAVENTAYFFRPLQPPLQNNGFSYSCQYNFEFKQEILSQARSGKVNFKESSYVQLVGGESRCLGSLKLEHEGEWRAVSQQHWGQKEAAVVCRQLQCGTVIDTNKNSFNPTELQPVWRLYSDCEGSERALLSCGSVREGRSASTVHVFCSDILYPAIINVVFEKNSSSALDFMVVYSPYSFYVTCSVPPQFPGGHFSLVFTGVEHSLTHNQTAANHSAVFTFDAAEKAHSGNYSCLYHNTVSGHNFSSRSQDITIVVEDAEDVRLDNGVARDFGSTVCSGTLLVKDRSGMMMVTAETLHWDIRHASIVCRQLGCGSALSTSKTDTAKVVPMWRFFSDCDGSEAALLECGHVQKWFSSKAIVVVCEE